MNPNNMFSLALLITAMAAVQSFSFSSSFAKHQVREKIAAPWTMYMPSNPSNPQNQPSTAQNMLKNVGTELERGSNWKLSHSVLADCDTLPSFPTAHGLLSPETVSRMDDMTHRHGHRNDAVETFIANYRQNGPMSCLGMLSDPNVLPHLTAAMRDIQ